MECGLCFAFLFCCCRLVLSTLTELIVERDITPTNVQRIAVRVPKENIRLMGIGTVDAQFARKARIKMKKLSHPAKIVVLESILM
jgi:hypothetical protein